jgi:hypothetical protein
MCNSSVCSIENDLMTPSMKLKRPQLQTRFQPQVGCVLLLCSVVLCQA